MGITDTSNAGSWDCHMLMAAGKSASTLGTSWHYQPRLKTCMPWDLAVPFPGWHPNCGLWVCTVPTRHACAQAALSSHPHLTNGATWEGSLMGCG